MFISRKKYEKAIKKAKMEAVRETEDRFHLWNRIERIEDQMYRRMNELDEKMNKIQEIRDQSITATLGIGFGCAHGSEDCMPKAKKGF